MHTLQHHADGIDRKEQVVESVSLEHFYLLDENACSKTNDPIDRIDNVCLVVFFLSLFTCLLTRSFAVYSHFFPFRSIQIQEINIKFDENLRSQI